MLIFAVIPARGGSKRLPGKNLMPLGGVPLIAWTIRASQTSGTINTTWLSTEDGAIAETARGLGAQVPFLRPSELAQDDSTTLAVVQHAVKEFEARQGLRPEVVVVLQPTSPLRQARHIDETVKLLLKTGADSAMTVTRDCLHPLHRYTLDGDRLKPLTLATDEQPIYRPNGAVYAARLPVLMEQNTLRGKDHRGVVMDFESSIDIDTLWDFKLAELILLSRREGARP